MEGSHLPRLVSGSALESFGDLRVKSRKVNGLGLGAGPGGGATQTDPVSDQEGNPRILLPECCKHPSSRNVQLQNSEL